MAVAAIAAFACPAQPALVERWTPDVVRSAIVTCHRGRRVVVSRARLVDPEDGPPTGRRIRAVDSAGRRVAWGEIRHGGGRARLSIVVGRLERGNVRRVHRRVVLRRAGGLDVVLTTRGELGWLTRGRVLTASIRGPARVVARNAARPQLGLEDDRTLRWFRTTGRILSVAYADLRPWHGGGCPVRRRFRVEAEGPESVVSTAFYGPWDEWVTAVRVCSRVTGMDPVVLQADGSFAGSTSVTLAKVSGPWAAIVIRSGGRIAPCGVETVVVVNALDPARRRNAAAGCDQGLAPTADEPLVVTDTGVPAWIVRRSDRSAVVTGTSGVPIELDSAGRDGITGLAVEGRIVHWLHDGEPRSAVLG